MTIIRYSCFWSPFGVTNERTNGLVHFFIMSFHFTGLFYLGIFFASLYLWGKKWWMENSGDYFFDRRNIADCVWDLFFIWDNYFDNK